MIRILILVNLITLSIITTGYVVKNISNLNAKYPTKVFHSCNSDDDSIEEYVNSVEIVRKKSHGYRDNRESLPYSIFYISEETSKAIIGTYSLDSSTACGDLLDLGKAGTFKVKRVSFLYKYTKFGFQVFRKRIDVTKGNISGIDDSINSKEFLQ
eukprot:gene20983-27192_t